jgi:5-methylcytosine-specific restriction protein A
MMRVTGKWLNSKYKIGAADARYRENGVWYHPLRAFPAVLFDGGGYVLFKTKADYLSSAYLKHGPDPNHIHVIDGLSSVPGYVVLNPTPIEFK